MARWRAVILRRLLSKIQQRPASSPSTNSPQGRVPWLSARGNSFAMGKPASTHRSTHDNGAWCVSHQILSIFGRWHPPRFLEAPAAQHPVCCTPARLHQPTSSISQRYSPVVFSFIPSRDIASYKQSFGDDALACGSSSLCRHARRRCKFTSRWTHRNRCHKWLHPPITIPIKSYTEGSLNKNVDRI